MLRSDVFSLLLHIVFAESIGCYRLLCSFIGIQLFRSTSSNSSIWSFFATAILRVNPWWQKEVQGLILLLMETLMIRPWGWCFQLLIFAALHLILDVYSKPQYLFYIPIMLHSVLYDFSILLRFSGSLIILTLSIMNTV